MHTARKIAATSSIALGLAMVSFAVPGIAQAADGDDLAATPAAATATPTDKAPSLDLDLKVPQVELDIPETLPTPTLPTTPGDPVETTEPTPEPTRPTDNPGDDVDVPGTPGGVETDDDSGNNGNGNGNGNPGDSTDDDSGSSDPGSGDSSSQGEDDNNGVDPVLGNGVAPQQGLQDGTPPAADTQRTLPAAGGPAQLPVLVLGLGLIVVGGVLVKRPYAARHRVV